VKKPEQYSTEKAWGVKTNRAQVEYFEKIANRLRRTNEQLQKTLTSKEMYIEKLEQKIESLERFSNIVLP
jgi:predicted RNase H-like nuclease (RuvC/YqgF family)